MLCYVMLCYVYHNDGSKKYKKQYRILIVKKTKKEKNQLTTAMHKRVISGGRKEGAKGACPPGGTIQGVAF